MNKKIFDLKKHFLNKNYNEVIKIARENINYGSDIPAVYNLLSVSLELTGKIEEAEKVLKDAIKKNSREISFRVNIGRIQRILKKYKDAEENLSFGIKIDDKDQNLLFQYGLLKKILKQFKISVKIFKKLSDLNINYPDALLYLAESYLDLFYDQNKKEYYKKAKEIFLKCSKIFPERVYVDFKLSDMIDYTIDDTHQKIMLNKLEKLNLNFRQKAFICKAIAKSFEDNKDYDQAYKFFKKFNEMRNKTIDKDIALNEEKKFIKIKRTFLKIISSNLNIESKTNKKIIFIVGLPRSGTTLVHQLIDTSKEIDGLGESSILDKNFSELLKENSNSINSFLEVGRNIIDEYNILSSKKIIIDKLPINFYWIGFIKLMFPNSKVIHVKRNLKDVFLSLYKNNFGNNQMDWCYDESNILFFIKNYIEIMNFWKSRYENFIFDLQYENLINNQIEVSRKLFKFCDIKWDKKIFDFYKSGKRINTASISQVKKSIYNTSIDSNKKYIKKMSFLKKLEKI